MTTHEQRLAALDDDARGRPRRVQAPQTTRKVTKDVRM